MGGGGLRSLGRRDIRVVLQPYRDRTDWSVRRRVYFGNDHRDSVLAFGSLRYDEPSDAPRDLIRDLRRICFQLERTFALTPPEGGSEPPRGGYGGDVPLPSLEAVSWAKPLDGQALDSSPGNR